MKLTKIETIDLIQQGAKLVMCYNNIQGKYFYIVHNKKEIWNINKKYCFPIIKELKLKALNINYNSTTFIVK